MDVAFELSKRHLGGGPVALAVLLVEAGLADDEAEGRRLGKARPGRAVAECLYAFKWRRRRTAEERQWKPPRRKRPGE